MKKQIFTSLGVLVFAIVLWNVIPTQSPNQPGLPQNFSTLQWADTTTQETPSNQQELTQVETTPESSPSTEEPTQQIVQEDETPQTELKTETQEKATKEQEAQVAAEAESQKQAEAEQKAKQETEAKTKAEQEAEAKKQAEAESQKQAEAEQKAKQEAEAKAKAEQEAQAKKQAEAAAAAKAAAEAAAPKTLASGNFQTVEVGTSGSVKFVKEWNKQTIQISNLNTSSAPNLELYLSKAGSISSSAGIGGSIKIAALRSPKGTQSYSVPANIDLSQYNSIAIHCTAFNKLFGSASLR